MTENMGVQKLAELCGLDEIFFAEREMIVIAYRDDRTGRFVEKVIPLETYNKLLNCNLPPRFSIGLNSYFAEA